MNDCTVQVEKMGFNGAVVQQISFPACARRCCAVSGACCCRLGQRSSQCLHNALQQRRLCPGARLAFSFWFRHLAASPLPSLETWRQGSDPSAGRGRIRDEHKAKPVVLWWLLQISQSLTCESFMGGNRIFPHFPCPVVSACGSHYLYLKIVLVQWIIDVGSLASLQELLSLTSDPFWIF